MTKRRFYKREYVIVLLSEEPIPECLELETIHYLMTEGHCSGIINDLGETKISGKRMASLLIQQGSDPEFFSLTQEGEDWSDDPE